MSENKFFVVIFIFLFSNLYTQTQSKLVKNSINTPEAVVNELYNLVTFNKGETPNWNRVKSLFIEQAVIVLRTSRAQISIFSVNEFIADFIKFIERADVSENGFVEKIIRQKSVVMGNMAHILVLYEACIPGSIRLPQQGVDSFSLIKMGDHWLIASITNEIPTPENPIPTDLQPEDKFLKSELDTLEISLLRHISSFLPDGWQLYDDVQQYTPENLYEQINGRAEYYIAYNVISATFAIFEKIDQPEFSITVSIYDMGKPLNAFGVFAGERPLDSPRIDLGRDAYISGANYYIWKGPYYVRIVAADTTSELKQVGMDLATLISDSLQDSGESIWGLKILMQKNINPQSIQYYLVDAFGFDFLNNTYTANYEKNNTTVTVFISQQESLASAKNIITKFKDHVKSYGESMEVVMLDDIEFNCFDMGRNYDVIFYMDTLIAGVIGIQDKKMSIEVAAEFWNELRLKK